MINPDEFVQETAFPGEGMLFMDKSFVDGISLRWLAENSSSTSSSNSTTNYGTNDAQVLRDTFTVYGPILLIIAVVFCLLRIHCPRAYTIRKWVDDLKTPLADDQHGYISWIWTLWRISDDEVRQECGLDSLCFLRVLRMGTIMSLVGIFNAIWLMPLYATASDTYSSGVLDVTISNVPTGSPRLIGTIIALYILMGFTMYFILSEFRWFNHHRHLFLSQRVPRNYAVYLRNIPTSLIDNSSVEHYFRRSFPNSVHQALLRVKIPSLTSQVSQRNTLVTKLEHTMAQDYYSRSLRANEKRATSIESYSKDLASLNVAISAKIDAILGGDSSSGCNGKKRESDLEERKQTNNQQRGEKIVDDSLSQQPMVPFDEDSAKCNPSDQTPLSLSFDTSNNDFKASIHERLDSSHQSQTGSENDGKNGIDVSSAFMPLMAVATSLKGLSEGELYSAGFVTFTKLSAAQATMQMVQNEEPFAMQVTEAPDPQDIMWSNVGRSHKDLQIGQLLSKGATVAICLLWTIPMAFIASLSSVAALKEAIPAFEDLFEAAPFLENVFQLVAPLLVPIVNSLLPVILGFLSSLEGPVSGAVNGASTFGKLAAFMIIQTFFVSTISGTIFEELSNLLNNPASIISLLATSLPAQATYFMQIVFVGTVIMVGFEILRVSPILFATIRSHLGPRLTEKERSTQFFIFQPLCNPSSFPHADLLSQTVLYFTVQLVYAVIAPLTSFILGFCFLYMGAAYRHQIVYIYPKTPDSGGKLWMNFIGVLIACMFIAQLTVLGLLLLMKSIAAIPMMIILLAFTAIFTAYIRQEHFRCASYLSLRQCSEVDDERSRDSFDFLTNAYLQDELKVRRVTPDLLPGQELPFALTDPESDGDGLSRDGSDMQYKIEC